MKKIVLESPGRFAESSAAIPKPAPGEALVQIERVGVCGSDFHAFYGRHPAYTYPRVLGHELSGVVVDVTPNGKGIRTGDACVIDPYLSCGNCNSCLNGRPNCCYDLRVLGIHVDGGMQEFLSVPISQLHKSDTLSLDELALVETLGISAHAVARSGISAGQDALVVGAGPIGIGVAQFAAVAGARVHIIEKSGWRREFVQELGFTAGPATEEKSADFVFDATGSAEAMSASLSLVATGGTLVYVGLTRDPVLLDDALFHRREMTLLASRNSCNQFARIILLMEQGKIDVRRWITHRLNLECVATEFESLPGQSLLIKAIVDMQDGKTARRPGASNDQ